MFQVHQCINEDWCEDRDVVDQFFIDNSFTFPIKAQKVDINNIDVTIHDFVVDDFWWDFDLDRITAIDIFIQKNLVSTYDSIFTIDKNW